MGNKGNKRAVPARHLSDATTTDLTNLITTARQTITTARQTTRDLNTATQHAREAAAEIRALLDLGVPETVKQRIDAAIGPAVQAATKPIRQDLIEYANLCKQQMLEGKRQIFDTFDTMVEKLTGVRRKTLVEMTNKEGSVADLLHALRRAVEDGIELIEDTNK